MNDRHFRDFVLAMLFGFIGVVAILLLIFWNDDPICNAYMELHSNYSRGVCSELRYVPAVLTVPSHRSVTWVS